jgi:hypothetical protein
VNLGSLFTIPMLFPWFSYGFPMVYLWYSYGFPMVFLWFTRPGINHLSSTHCITRTGRTRWSSWHPAEAQSHPSSGGPWSHRGSLAPTMKFLWWNWWWNSKTMLWNIVKHSETMNWTMVSCELIHYRNSCHSKVIHYRKITENFHLNWWVPAPRWSN